MSVDQVAPVRPPQPASASHFVDGAWDDSGERSVRVGPWTRESATAFVTADRALVDRALAATGRHAAQVARLAPATRADVLERAAVLATERRDDVARLIALELGKPLRDGRGEMDRVAETFTVCAHEARDIGGDVLPVAGYARGVGNTAMTYRAPLGTALVITPFNAPANLLAHKLGASFAAGNTTIVKAPPQAPATSEAVVRILLDAGMPVAAVQLLHGGGEVGAWLSAAPEVAVISFTGSAATGAAVARAAGAKRLVLELGGNAATIVCADADVAAAARACAATGYTNSGQSCISVQRIYVHASVVDAFLDRLATEVDQLVVGDPLDEGTQVGSMVDDAAAARVEGWVEEARSDGATVLRGGTRDGATLAPTIVAHPSPTATLVREEVFGALVAVMAFDDLADVIETCNSSRYGLQAGLFTRDIDTIVTAWRELEVGGLIVNGTSNYRLDHLPFGGVKDSGFGRETPKDMIADFTNLKTLVLRGTSVWGEQ